VTSAELLREVRRRFADLADPGFASNLRWFFRDQDVDPYGVRGSSTGKLVQFSAREIRRWRTSERNRFCSELFKSGKLEEGVLAAHLYRRFRKQCREAEFRLFERWIDRYVRNWSHCDAVAAWLLAACIENEPRLGNELRAWTKSKNRWKRRAAAVALLQEAKNGRHTAEILDIAGLLRDDPDLMVQKGVGWLLKEAYLKRPRELAAYMQAWTGPRLVVRYAAEKMSPGDRGALGLRA
jgi:3-methyladenine DNA glycosylase AlkD